MMNRTAERLPWPNLTKYGRSNLEFCLEVLNKKLVMYAIRVQELMDECKGKGTLPI